MAGQDQSPPVQGFQSVSSSDYVSPSHLEPCSPSVVVTEQGDKTQRSTSGPEMSTSGRHQATAQLDNRSRCPPIVGRATIQHWSLAPHNQFYLLHDSWNFHSCGRNSKYSSHIINQNSYKTVCPRPLDVTEITVATYSNRYALLGNCCAGAMSVEPMTSRVASHDANH